MIRYLLDTNVVSLYSRRDEIVTERIHQVPASQLSASAITAMELEFGIRRNPDLGSQVTRRIRTLLREIEIIPYEAQDALETADIRVFLETTRFQTSAQPVGKLDAMIAATALTRNLICVTRNIGEFSRIANLQLEDWTVA